VRECRNRQTGLIWNQVGASHPWGFESPLPHHTDRSIPLIYNRNYLSSDTGSLYISRLPIELMIATTVRSPSLRSRRFQRNANSSQ
jgi:hypothetical protein